MNYRPHPLADLFPMMEDSELSELAADIKQNGLRAKVTLFDGKILDGRNRYRACELAGVQPEFREHKNGEPLAFVISANLHRRHLSTSQRALIAASLANMPQGQPASEKKPANLRVTQEEAAKKLNVSERAVQEATKILNEAPKKQIEAIKSGEKTIHKVTEEEKVKSAAKNKEERRDAIGRVIPEAVVPDWDRAAAVASRLRSCASEIKVTVERGLADKDIIFAEITNPTISEASGLHYTLSQMVPHSICPSCQGLQRKGCQLCKRRGWISKFIYNSPSVSAETRALLEKVAAKGKL